MADRRNVRSSSRRITPTPQPPSTVTTPQPGRPSRRRGTRSASREVESVTIPAKPSRRTARQASVTSESEQEGRRTRRTKRKAQNEAAGDLTTVEEVESQIALEMAAQTPPRPQQEVSTLHRSPGTVSEMSGTTAISSFSMVEAEMLDSRLIQRHLPKLYNESAAFLHHLAPDDARIEQDVQHIQEMQKPDSQFTKDYRDFDADFESQLSHFRSEHQQYIRLRAIRRALFGPDRDPNASQSGLDLILYQANLAILAKQMIGSDRNQKEIFDALRQLDGNQFPQHFLCALTDGPLSSPSGDSALLKKTFDLALDLRTHLAIILLERGSAESDFNPDEILEDVFLNSEGAVRGWDVAGLGGPDDKLSKDFSEKIVRQVEEIRAYSHTDTQSIGQGEPVDLDNLGNNFPWRGVILQLLDWVRHRHRELEKAIQGLGGITSIVERVQAEIEQTLIPENRAPSNSQTAPPKGRTSFGRDRRRSGRKFHLGDISNDAIVDALAARSRGSGEQARTELTPQVPGLHEPLETVQDQFDGQDDWVPPLDDDGQQQIEEAAIEEPSASAPPKSTADIVNIMKEAKKLDKENRGNFFARQMNAERIEFGDGFDGTQATPGPSRKGKEPQRPPPRKRRLPVTDEISDDEDAFETDQRPVKVTERRQKAPVTKRVRIDPASSAPTSHQPPPRNVGTGFIPEEIEESLSEQDAPEMTEEQPPSTYNDQKYLAERNSTAVNRAKGPQVRARWSAAAEEAFINYMATHPQKYAAILAMDDPKTGGGPGHLIGRTQVNLKDKARNMAITMIK